MATPTPEELLARWGMQRIPNTSLTAGVGRPQQPAPTPAPQSPPRPTPQGGGVLAQVIAEGQQSGVAAQPQPQQQESTPWYKKAIGTVLGNGAVQNALKPLDWLQTGGRAAVAGTENLARAIEDSPLAPIFPADRVVDVDRELEGSWWDRARQSDYGYGTIIDDNAGDWIGVNKVLGDKWGDRAIGLAGDVLLDPLTYATLGAGAAAGAGGRAGRVALAGEAALKGFSDDAVRTISAKGIPWLDDAQRAELGLGKAGIHFAGARLPGTGGVARTIGKATSTARHQIFGRRPWQFVARTPRGLAVDLTEAHKALTQVGYRGAMSPRKAATLVAFDDAVRREGQTIANETAHVAEQMFRGTNEAQRVAMTHGAEAGQDGPMRQLFNHFKHLADQNGVEMGTFDDYVPHIWTKEAQDALKSRVQVTKGGSKVNLLKEAGASKSRGITAGEYTINGQKVVFKTGSVQEINEVLTRRFPELGVTKWLEDDARKLVDEYIGSMATMIGSAKALQATIAQAPDVMDFLDNVGDDVLDFAATRLKSKKLKSAFQKSLARRNELQAKELKVARGAAESLQRDIVDRLETVVDEALAVEKGRKHEAVTNAAAAKSEASSLRGRAGNAMKRLQTAQKQAEKELAQHRAAIAKLEEERVAAEVARPSRPELDKAWTAQYEKTHAQIEQLRRTIELGEKAQARFDAAMSEAEGFLNVAFKLGEASDDPDFLQRIAAAIHTQDKTVRVLADGAELRPPASMMTDGMYDAWRQTVDAQIAEKAAREVEALRAALPREAAAERVNLEEQLAATTEALKWAKVRSAEARRRVTAAYDSMFDARAEAGVRNSDGQWLSPVDLPARRGDERLPSQLDTMAQSAKADARKALRSGAGTQRVQEAMNVRGGPRLVEMVLSTEDARKAAREAYQAANAERRAASDALLELNAARNELTGQARPLRADLETATANVELDDAAREAAEARKAQTQILREEGVATNIDAVMARLEEAKARADQAATAFEQTLDRVEQAIKAAGESRDDAIERLFPLNDELMAAEAAARSANDAFVTMARTSLPPDEAAVLDSLVELDNAIHSVRVLSRRQAEFERRARRAQRVGSSAAGAALSARTSLDAELKRLVRHNQAYSASDWVNDVIKVRTNPRNPRVIAEELEAAKAPEKYTATPEVATAISKRGIDGGVRLDEVLGVGKDSRITDDAVLSAPQSVQDEWFGILDDLRASAMKAGTDVIDEKWLWRRSKTSQDRARFLGDWMVRHKAAIDAGATPSEELSAEITRRVIRSEIDALEIANKRRVAVVKKVSDEMRTIERAAAAAELALDNARKAARAKRSQLVKARTKGAANVDQLAKELEELRANVTRTEKLAKKARSEADQGIPKALIDADVDAELKEQFDDFARVMIADVQVAEATEASAKAEARKQGMGTGRETAAGKVPTGGKVQVSKSGKGRSVWAAMTKEQWEEAGRPRVGDGGKWAWRKPQGPQATFEDELAALDAGAIARRGVMDQAIGTAKQTRVDFASTIRSVVRGATGDDLKKAVRDSEIDHLWDKAGSAGRLRIFNEIAASTAGDTARIRNLRRFNTVLGGAEEGSRVGTAVDADWRDVLGGVLRGDDVSTISARRASLEQELEQFAPIRDDLLKTRQEMTAKAVTPLKKAEKQRPAIERGQAAQAQLDELPAPAQGADRVVGDMADEGQRKVDELAHRRGLRERERDRLAGQMVMDIAATRAEQESLSQAAVAADMRAALWQASADQVDTYADDLSKALKKSARNLPKSDRAALKRVDDDTRAILEALKTDEELADVAALHATYQAQLAELARADGSVAELEKAIKDAGSTAKKVRQDPEKNFVNVFTKALDDAESKWVMLGDDTVKPGGRTVVVDKEIAEAFARARNAAETGELGMMLDRMTQFFKTYATATPGFHVRNAMSATFMNIVAGVSMESQAAAARSWKSYTKDPIGFMRRIETEDPQLFDAYKAAFGAGAGGNFSRAELGNVHSKAFNNAWTRLNRRLGERVEGGVRVGMAYDTIRKGGSIEAAQRKVEMFHFNYSKLSDLDRNMKRLIPFWTFMSRNLPLQIQMMYQRPGAYTAWDHFADNFGMDVEAMPQWLADRDAVALSGNDQEGFTAFAPDLPHLNLGADLSTFDVSNPSRVLSNLNPVAIAPIEALADHNFFYDGPLTDDGDVGDRAWHAASNIVSPLAQGQRLSGTGRYQGRVEENWANFFGLPFRDVSPERMQAEMRRRAFEQ